MTQLFQSKSCVLRRSNLFDSVPPSPSSLYLSHDDDDEEEDEEEEEDDEQYQEEREENDEEGSGCFANSISTPLIVPGARENVNRNRGNVSRDDDQRQSHQYPILEFLIEALRKSLVTCTNVGTREDICSMDIGWPTEVRHVSHVTFDRFNGFLGLPVEFEPEIPTKVPSASASVFGVSAESMQCSYDHRGNSVPTILLMMQRRLYSEGGLQAEGIFRITAENSQEENVRSQLNRGVVLPGIDVHCLAGLIKAWFRELPAGVLDSITPEQVMHCNTEEECTQVASLLPPTEFALLDWAINLMADVVQHENQNKMNARNIAMVFAPNMTQMADPLTALFHAVQVMNFLKTLIIKVLREREKSSADVGLFSSCSESPNNKDDPNLSKSNNDTGEGSCEQATDVCVRDGPPVSCSFPKSSSRDRLERDNEDIFWSLQDKSEAQDGDHEFTCGNNECGGRSKCHRHDMYMENECGGRSGSLDVGGFSDRISWREGVRRLCRNPVFQLTRPIKKSAGFGILNI